VPPGCYAIGGTVSGLTGSGLVLQDSFTNTTLNYSGLDSDSVTGNGSFTFPTALATGSSYNVTVTTQPAGQTCSVTNGSGNVGTSNITSVVVTCSAVVAGGPPAISNVYYIYNLDGEAIDNIEFTSSNLFYCNVGDLDYAISNNDAQYNLSGVPGNGTYNNGFYVPLPTAFDTITLTCYDSTGTIPVFGGPVLITNPDLPTPDNQLTISSFTADVDNNALLWSTSYSTPNTVCSLLDEFGNQPEAPNPNPQAPILNLLPNSSQYDNAALPGEYYYPNNSAACPETNYPDTVTLTCTDPNNGAAVKTVTVSWSPCID
jgi:hypothetical protein